MTKQRCGWCSEDPLYMHYHDHEWGKANHDETHLFEMLCLEGQQAGLSWITVLKKRDCYRKHFFQHAIADIAALTEVQLQEKLKFLKKVNYELSMNIFFEKEEARNLIQELSNLGK